MSDLPLYEENRLCVKCGWYGEALTQYTIRELGVPGVLERTCPRCRYQWDEAPLDSVGEERK